MGILLGIAKTSSAQESHSAAAPPYLLWETSVSGGVAYLGHATGEAVTVDLRLHQTGRYHLYYQFEGEILRAREQFGTKGVLSLGRVWGQRFRVRLNAGIGLLFYKNVHNILPGTQSGPARPTNHLTGLNLGIGLGATIWNGLGYSVGVEASASGLLTVPTVQYSTVNAGITVRY